MFLFRINYVQFAYVCFSFWSGYSHTDRPVNDVTNCTSSFYSFDRMKMRIIDRTGGTYKIQNLTDSKKKFFIHSKIGNNTQTTIFFEFMRFFIGAILILSNQKYWVGGEGKMIVFYVSGVHKCLNIDYIILEWPLIRNLQIAFKQFDKYFFFQPD